MWWKNKLVPFDWKIGDTINNIPLFSLNWHLGTLMSISPCRKYFIIRAYVSNELHKVKYNSYYKNSRTENNKFSTELTEWEEYNQALKELQDKFNI
jgi:hypothetical protein